MMNVRLQYCIRDMASINMPHLLRICVVGCRVKKSQCNESAIVLFLQTKRNFKRNKNKVTQTLVNVPAGTWYGTLRDTPSRNKNETAPFRATHMIWQASSF